METSQSTRRGCYPLGLAALIPIGVGGISRSGS
jgi:hypothetical protein